MIGVMCDASITTESPDVMVPAWRTMGPCQGLDVQSLV